MPGLKVHPIRQNPSARLGISIPKLFRKIALLGDGADFRVPGNRLKMILK
jgi:hypothetical protein